MNINKINNINFQRAIKINSSSNRFDENKRVNDSTRAVFYTLYNSAPESNTASFYDRETSYRIRNFLIARIKDYNPQTGFFLRKIKGEIYIFTGDDVKKVKEADKKLSRKNNALKKELDEKMSEEISPKIQKKVQRRYDLQKNKFENMRDEKLLELVEDNVQINVDMDENHRAQKIEYVSKNDNKIAIKTLII